MSTSDETSARLQSIFDRLRLDTNEEADVAVDEADAASAPSTSEPESDANHAERQELDALDGTPSPSGTDAVATSEADTSGGDAAGAAGDDADGPAAGQPAGVDVAEEAAPHELPADAVGEGAAPERGAVEVPEAAPAAGPDVGDVAAVDAATVDGDAPAPAAVEGMTTTEVDTAVASRGDGEGAAVAGAPSAVVAEDLVPEDDPSVALDADTVVEDPVTSVPEEVREAEHHEVGAAPSAPSTTGVVDEGAEVPVLAAQPDAPALPRRPLPRILAVANQKGGVGKTTTAVNLSAALAELGYRVLVVDLDPQGNASTGLGINARSLEATVYDVLMRDLPVEDAIEPTSVRNLFVVPATIDLAGAEIELVPAFSRELKLKRALEAVGDDFDYTIIDCPPSLGLLTVNALSAAGEVVVPIQCEYYALEGLGQLLRNVQMVRGSLNPSLEVSTIILTMYDARTKLAEQVASEVRDHFGPIVCRHIVPRAVRLSEAPSYGQPIIAFDPSSRGAIAYRELAKEVSGGAPQRVG